MRRIVSIAVVLAVLAGAVVLGGASSEDKGTEYKIVFDNAFGLVEGGDFRVGGVTAGETSEFSIEKRKGQSAKAVVTAKITKPGLADFRKDAECTIRPQSLIGEYFVDCQPGNSGEKLPKDGNGRVPVKQTSSSIPIDLVQNILRRPYRERFRLIVNELGTGLAGRPQDLQEVLKRAHPGLRETSKVLRILGDQNSVIENFIKDSDTIVAELENNKNDVVRFIREAGEAAEITSTRRAELRANLERLPTFLAELRPTMAALERLTDEQTPLLGDLNRAAPSLRTFLTRLGPFSEASRPALRALGRASEVGERTFKEGAEEINALADLAPEAQPAFKPVRQFLETMDDRRRATDGDARAKVNGPPSTDRSYNNGSGGFTGLEAILNYPFWQSLSLNAYDGVSHLLRLGVSITPCSQLENNPESEEIFKLCEQWVGPNLPGLTTPDFTENPSTLARLRAEARKPARRVGERRSEGQPDAAPLPGQRDISKPQLVLPPKVQQLLDQLAPQQGRPGEGQRSPLLDDLQRQLGGGAARRQGNLDDRSAGQLLDFLLGQ